MTAARPAGSFIDDRTQTLSPFLRPYKRNYAAEAAIENKSGGALFTGMCDEGDTAMINADETFHLDRIATGSSIPTYAAPFLRSKKNPEPVGAFLLPAN